MAGNDVKGMNHLLNVLDYDIRNCQTLDSNISLFDGRRLKVSEGELTQI